MYFTLDIANPRIYPIRRYGHRSRLSWEYSFPAPASFSRYPDRQAYRAARVLCGRSRPRFSVLVRGSRAASHTSIRTLLKLLCFPLLAHELPTLCSGLSSARSLSVANAWAESQPVIALMHPYAATDLLWLSRLPYTIS